MILTPRDMSIWMFDFVVRLPSLFFQKSLYAPSGYDVFSHTERENLHTHPVKVHPL